MPDNVSDAEAVHLADLNYAASYRLLGRHAAGGSVYEEPGLVAAITGEIAWLNVTVVTEELTDPTGAIRRAIEFYRTAGAPFVMRVRAGFGLETQRAMRELGLEPAEQLPGMVLSPVNEIPPLPDGLSVTAWDAGSLATYNEIMAEAFEMPVQMMNDLIGPSLLTSHVRGYLGHVDGRPVATSALIASDGVAGVYNVSTLPEYRKRGLGEAMTWHAVREGVKAGCRIGSLQASAMGQPVYARMGFRNIAPYESYVSPAAPVSG
jgi:GNAT superfamily N-acetyltransferase